MVLSQLKSNKLGHGSIGLGGEEDNHSIVQRYQMNHHIGLRELDQARWYTTLYTSSAFNILCNIYNIHCTSNGWYFEGKGGNASSNIYSKQC